MDYQRLNLPCLTQALIHKLSQQSVKVVGASLPGNGVATVAVEAGAGSLLNLLYDILILHLYLMKIGTYSLTEFILIHNIG